MSFFFFLSSVFLCVGFILKQTLPTRWQRLAVQNSYPSGSDYLSPSSSSKVPGVITILLRYIGQLWSTLPRSHFHFWNPMQISYTKSGVKERSGKWVMGLQKHTLLTLSLGGGSRQKILRRGVTTSHLLFRNISLAMWKIDLKVWRQITEERVSRLYQIKNEKQQKKRKGELTIF